MQQGPQRPFALKEVIDIKLLNTTNHLGSLQQVFLSEENPRKYQVVGKLADNVHLPWIGSWWPKAITHVWLKQKTKVGQLGLKNVDQVF